MTVVIKMMNGGDLPDTNTSKGFALITVNANQLYRFYRRENGSAFLCIKSRDENGQDHEEHHYLHGNCYVMDNGKTIASFARDPYTSPKDL